jgi:hypothetical protein
VTAGGRNDADMLAIDLMHPDLSTKTAEGYLEPICCSWRTEKHVA